MKVGEGMRNRLGIAGELLSFLWQQKMWWLIPMVIVLLGVRRPAGHRPELGARAVHLHALLMPGG